MVLHHAVDIVAGHAEVLTRLFLQDAELVAIVTVETITGGHPDESIAIEVYLCRKTT